MTDLDALDADDFEPLIGDVFARPLDDGGSVDLRLTSVDRGRAHPDRRSPFSLLLVGPAGPVLEPDVHPLVHPGLGRLELFVGPVLHGPPDPTTTTYEIVFT